MVINISGISSTGKSTITEIAGSLYASPTMSKGLVRSFNATKNALLAQCEGKYGLPILLDDINANRTEHDKIDLIYQLALNDPRSRCGRSGYMQDTHESWSGIVMITSENPMFDTENVTQGIYARCMIVADVVWTQDASHSERIKQGVRENYGFVGLEFAKYIEGIGEENILQKCKEAESKVLALINNNDNLSNRIASKLAPIYVTAELISQNCCSGLYDINKVMEYLIEADRKVRLLESYDEIVLSKLKEFVLMNRNHFDVNTQRYPITKNSDLFGAVLCSKKEQSFNILKPAFDMFLNNNKITDKLVVLRAWKAKGLIKCDSDDRYDTKVSALGNQRAIKLFVKPEEAEFFLPEASRVKMQNARVNGTQTIPEIKYPEESNENIWRDDSDGN